MSPTATASGSESEQAELLGSLTTQQQQRTSARVIKKLKLEPPTKGAKRNDGQADELTECDTPSKIDDKDLLKFPTVKQRMPKALWSTDEKSLFFEALNEYGKDFDAITAHICAKMKKKGMPDVNLKTKTQVSHFYYRTWHKLSKHVHFDENVKKVAQELYALINYGELRKKLASVSEKTCARLSDMVRDGSIVVRARGRNVRVRTPACRALRKLNQIAERACGARVCSRAGVWLRARDSCAWARVQAAAHNPRAHVSLPLRTGLRAFIKALADRWSQHPNYKLNTEESTAEVKCCEETKDNEESNQNQESTPRTCLEDKDDEREDVEDHLHLETDRIIVEEQRQPKKVVLHLGPKPSAEINLPVLSPSEQLSSQKICFSSYLERMCSQRRDKDGGSKLRTPKRQRKDSATDKDKEVEPKKFKEDNESHKLMNIDETAIDGIELMANYKNILEDEEKPSTEDEKEIKAEETADEELQENGAKRDKDLLEKDKEVPESEKDVVEREKEVSEKDKDMSEKEKDMSEKEKDSFSEMEDDEKYNKSDTDNESDPGKNEKSGKQTKFKNLKVKFRIRPKKRGGSIYTLVLDKEQEEVKMTDDQKTSEDDPKPDIDVELAIRQIKKGWSEYDAGDLTIGDLYLMFGSRSKLELDYWWAEPTSPLPQPPQAILKTVKQEPDKEKHVDKKEKTDKTPDKPVEVTMEDGERARESDTDIFSPKIAYGQDSNDGMSGDERKNEQLASPDHKASSCTLKLTSKLINRPTPNQQHEQGFNLLRDRLKRLLSFVGNPHVSATTSSNVRCNCGHVCSQRRQGPKQQTCIAPPRPPEQAPIFRHPTPIAPRPDNEMQQPLNLDGVPRWRRGRPRVSDRRVVVQRLLPLLPKLPPPSNLLPVKIVPNSPPPLPRLLPKPPSTSSSDLSFLYVLSESNGQFFFHDGDRRIPITPQDQDSIAEEDLKEDDVKDQKPDATVETKPDITKVQPTSNGEKPANPDIGSFLPSESMSLSPSRLLRETEGWFESSVQDFSLSSFLGHLEGRPQPDLAVDTHLQSLMAESSVDYVAKFADLAAEVTDEGNEDLT
ncbi:unnamed protein product [Chilo suppressalis]|uniref:SANT domain-containing protein n=1 Tax=Chilo suppressalis TaxID=168631 RepID=A0ABN8AUY6_CHISP|nr:unnamed protein product [Chilo suppressalis]